MTSKVRVASGVWRCDNKETGIALRLAGPSQSEALVASPLSRPDELDLTRQSAADSQRKLAQMRLQKQQGEDAVPQQQRQQQQGGLIKMMEEVRG